MNIVLSPIGLIHTPFESKEACPIQGIFSQKAKGTVEVFESHAEGLKDIEGFSHLFLIYYFDRAGEIEYVRSTFLDDTPHGIYASRHPCRPNGIGMSIVELLKRENNRLIVAGIDVLDQTPLIDIKPYIPKFDLVENASEGWTAGKRFHLKPPGRE